MVIAARASDGAARSRIGRSVDFITVDREVGNQGNGFRHGEAVSGVSGNLHAILRPAGESIARVGCRSQGSGSSLVIIARTRDGSAGSRTGRSGDSKLRDALGRETHLFTVGRASAVGGIGADIIGSAGCQPCHRTGEAARSRAIGGMVATDGRILRCAPADTASSHFVVSGIRDIAAAHGCGLGDLADGHRGDSGQFDRNRRTWHQVQLNLVVDIGEGTAIRH